MLVMRRRQYVEVKYAHAIVSTAHDRYGVIGTPEGAGDNDRRFLGDSWNFSLTMASARIHYA
jgi:hypothetical protein